MSVLAARRCERHSAREAVARCPSCSGHFCRECVIEHAGLLLCAACLAREAAETKKPAGTRWRQGGRAVRLAAAFLLLWTVFYSLGQLLKLVPAKVHEGTVWRIGDS